jgi:hypothetical protein
VRPKLGRAAVWLPAKSYLTWEGVVLPLASGGMAVDMFLGAFIVEASDPSALREGCKLMVRQRS